MRFAEIARFLSGIVVIAFCLFLIGLAVMIAIKPSVAERFLRSFASSARSHWFPSAQPGAYAPVGMGTLFADMIRAPMTSVFTIFEITQDYQILVPLMMATF